VTRVTRAKPSRIDISAATRTPRNFAPRSMLSEPRTWTKAIVTRAQAHHGGAKPR
jgi:hypothetical protein